MATNNEVIQYYGRSSQTVHRNSLTATEDEDTLTNNSQYYENVDPPESRRQWPKQFYTLNIPPNLARNFTPGLMVRSETVHRNGSFVPAISTPASLRELPSPKSLFNKKRASAKRKLENNNLPFNAVSSHLKDIKAKQAKFEWELGINRKLDLEPAEQQKFMTESVISVATTPATPLNVQVLENSAQENQREFPANSEISVDVNDEFTFRPMITFQNYNKRRETENSSIGGLFQFAEE